MPAKQIFVVREGKPFGPYTPAQIRDLAATGRVSPTDMIRVEGQEKTVPAGEIRGLVFPPPAAAAPAANTQPAPTSKVPPTPAASPPVHDRAFHQMLASWIFGTLLVLFFAGVFFFAPSELPAFKQRMLAISSALLAGLFAFFLTGSIKINAKGAKTWFGEFGMKATGGAAAFALVLVWWWTPAAPVGLEGGSHSPTAGGPQSELEKGLQAFGINASVSEETKKKLAAAQAEAKKAGQKFQETVGSGLTDITKNIGEAKTISDRFAWKVDLSRRKLNSADFANLESFTVMSTLMLSGAQFDRSDLRYLGDLRNIRDLAIDGTSLMDADLEQIAQMRDLETLNLADTAVSDAGLKHLARLDRLSKLSLARTQVKGPGLKTMRRPYLNRLSLRGCPIDDSAIASLPDVAELDLGETSVGDAGIAQLKGNSLRRLYLDGAKVSDDGIQALESRLVRCKVERKPPAETPPTKGSRPKTPAGAIDDVKKTIGNLKLPIP